MYFSIETYCAIFRNTETLITQTIFLYQTICCKLVVNAFEMLMICISYAFYFTYLAHLVGLQRLSNVTFKKGSSGNLTGNH